jgi:hypothetical protein
LAYAASVGRPQPLLSGSRFNQYFRVTDRTHSESERFDQVIRQLDAPSYPH